MSQQPAQQPKQDRRHQRYELQQPIPVIDQQTGASMGALVNITIEGLMVMANSELESNRLYQLALQLPEPVNGFSSIELGVDCLWSRGADQVQRYWAGFQIIDASQEAIKVIEALIRTGEQ